MNPVPLVLLLVPVALAAVVLVALRRLSRQVAELRDGRGGGAPAALAPAREPSAAPLTEEAVRRAVGDALAADREREITEARAFWAEQEARAAEDAPPADGPLFGDGSFDPVDSWPLFLPRPAGPEDAAGTGEPGVPLPPPRSGGGTRLDEEFAEALRSAIEELIADSNGRRRGHPVQSGLGAPAVDAQGTAGTTGEAQAADAPAAGEPPAGADPRRPDPRRHPSHPEFVPTQSPSREWTDSRLEKLAFERVGLCDVRPGPLGTLDVYAFEDGTTLCVAPGNREAAGRLIDAVRDDVPVHLLGGSCISGSYTLTFAVGEGTVYVLADRVVASL